HYQRLLDRFLPPDLGGLPLKVIDADIVEGWHAALPAKTPTQWAHANSLLHAIMTTATGKGYVPKNPCKMQGDDRSRRPIRSPIPRPAPYRRRPRGVHWGYVERTDGPIRAQHRDGCSALPACRPGPRCRDRCRAVGPGQTE